MSFNGARAEVVHTGGGKSKFDSASGAAHRCNRSADCHVVLDRQFLDAVACGAEQWARSVRTPIVTCSARWSQVLVPTALKHAVSWQLTSFSSDETCIEPSQPSPPRRNATKNWDGERFGHGSTTTTRAAARVTAGEGSGQGHLRRHVQRHELRRRPASQGQDATRQCWRRSATRRHECLRSMCFLHSTCGMLHSASVSCH